MKYDFQDKKVLVLGLGLLGGGVATIKWLLEQKPEKVFVADIKSEKELEPSIAEIKKADADGRVDFSLLGREHEQKDFNNADYIVAGPGVPREKYKDAPKDKLINDALIFFNLVKNPIIAVTGTRGKTTTTNWIAHFLKAKWPNVQIAGNTPENPLLNAISSLEKDPKTPVVVELSSWQLEFLDPALMPASAKSSGVAKPASAKSSGVAKPDIAVITNLYEDHMNRYDSMEEYASAKANIFKNQAKDQTLILKEDDEWTEWFLEQKPISKILYSSSAELTTGGITTGIDGGHNMENLRMAFVVANSMGISWRELGALTGSLPTLRFRQQYIYENDKLLIVNDSASTSPDAGIVAIRWFPEEARRKHLSLFFIAGGTDKGLSYEKWAEVLASEMSKCRDIERLEFRLFLLEGSATDKMEKALSKYRDVEMSRCRNIEMSKYQDLESLVQDVKKKVDEAGGGIIVFSPGAASFEKFKNEFDRGEQFGGLVKKYLVI